MPSLDTEIHLKMLAHSKRPVVRRLRMARRILAKQGRWAEDESSTAFDRIKAACGAVLGPPQIYGLEWGDPEVLPSLRHVRDHFLAPYVTPQATVLEIGPGGGRWTRYLLGAKQVYLVDFHQELLDELGRSMQRRPPDDDPQQRQRPARRARRRASTSCSRSAASSTSISRSSRRISTASGPC